MGGRPALPTGWESCSIGCLCDLINGRGFKRSERSPSGLPIIRIQNLNNPNASFNYYDGEYSEGIYVRKGDMLFAWSGTPGTSFGAHIWNGPEGLLNQHIYRVLPDDDLIAKDYFVIALNSKLAELIEGAHGGVGLRHITKPKLEAAEIGLPPLNEQRRIADKTDALQAKSRRAREALKAVGPLLEKFRQSVFLKAFSRPSSEEVPFSEVIDSTFYGPRFSKENYVDNGTITLRTTDFTENGDISLKSPPSVSVTTAEMKKWGLIDGDLLITRTGSIGKCALYSDSIGPALPSAYLIRVRLLKDAIDPYYALFFLQSLHGQRQLGLGITAVTQPNINAKAIRSILIPVPAIDVQREVVSGLRSFLTKIQSVESSCEDMGLVHEYLEQSILAKAFRGELVPQDPNDEPASVLLERIKAEREAGTDKKRTRKKTE